MPERRSKRLLVVAAAFPPGAVGSERALQVVRHIGAYGFEPAVLTTPGRCAREVDPTSRTLVPPGVPIDEVPCWSPWNHARWWRRARPGPARWAAAAGRALARATAVAVPVDEHAPWSRVAARRAVELVRRRGIDVVWITAPPLSSLRLAHALQHEARVPLVADFRDVRDLSGRSRRARSALRLEARALAACSGITTAAPDQVERLRARHPALARTPHRLVTGAFDPEEAEGVAAHRFERPSIVHGGTLYGGARRLDGLAEALRRVRDAAPPASAPELVAFSERGRSRAYLADVSHRFGLADALLVRDLVPRREFLAACRGARILLIAVGRDRGDQVHGSALPAKLYTYFAAARPILVTGPPGCEAGRVVGRHRRGLFAPDDDPAAIAAALRLLLAERDRSGPLDLSRAAVSAYETPGALRPLAELLDAVKAP